MLSCTERHALVFMAERVREGALADAEATREVFDELVADGLAVLRPYGVYHVTRAGLEALGVVLH